MYLPTWTCDLTRRRLRLDAKTPVLVSRPVHSRAIVSACCGVAAAGGVFVGMTLSHAKALLPCDAHVEAADPSREARLLRRLAVWATRFVPVVAVSEPDGLFLDASGCERLYGGLNPLLRRIQRAMRKLGFAARLAAAPSWGGAWALARFGDSPCISVIRSGLAESLRPLPIEALRIGNETVGLLREVGITRIGELMALPRSNLAHRYGQALLRRLDQALGEAFELIEPIRIREPVYAERLFDGPTDRIEVIEIIARELLEQVCGQLAARESGCRELYVRLLRSDLAPLDLTVRTSRLSRDGKHLWKLLSPQLEKAQLGFGVEGMRVRASGVGTIRHHQTQCMGREPMAPNEETDGRASDPLADPSVAMLVDVLAARLGPGGVMRAVPLASFLPEQAFRFEAVQHLLPVRINADVVRADRPSMLLNPPVPVDVVLLRPGGPITSVAMHKRLLRVRSCIGPERIGAEWWNGEDGDRDYFKVATDDGRWLWIFFAVQRSRWFLHGEWT